jgi:multidrug efflux pump subunit AcrB
MSFVLFPTKGAERIFINAELPMGSSLEATSTKMREIEALVAELPSAELENHVTTIGMAGWPPIGQAENYGMVMVRLTPYSERLRSADQIVEELRRRTATFAGYEKIIFDVDAGGPPVGEAINLRVVGADDAMRGHLADEVEAILASIPGVKDVQRDDIRGKDQLEIDLDYTQLARLGLTVADVARSLRAAYDGELVTSIRMDDEEVPFRVRLADRARRNERYLLGLQVPNDTGRLVRLGAAARLRSGPGPNAYRHYQGQRAITITADVDTDRVSPVEATATVLDTPRLATDWPGMDLVVGGEAAESERSMWGLAFALSLALVGIYFLLVLLFDSFAQPLLVLVAIPFGVVGVILALALHREPLGFLALTGVIGLIGVVVNDSLVLVSHLNRLTCERPEEDLRSLIARGTSERLRPVLLTTVTTAAGMLPLAYGLGGYDLYMAPMALTLGYGLLFATPLTLVLVPSLYLIGSDIARLLARGRGRRIER